MASEEESERTKDLSAPALSDTSELLKLDDRVFLLEHEIEKHTRHLSQVEGALFNQMITLSVLELVFALFLACMIWVEYRRRTECEERT